MSARHAGKEDLLQSKKVVFLHQIEMAILKMNYCNRWAKIFFLRSTTIVDQSIISFFFVEKNRLKN